MTLGLKFLLCINGKLFDFKKTSFRWSLYRHHKDAMGTARNYHTL